MFRRCISLLVIAGFLVSHLAAIPHAHGAVSAAEREKHDATPHFHCSWFSSHHSLSRDHSQSHDHSHSGHSHSHKTADELAGSPEGQLNPRLDGPAHDADAISVPQVMGSVRVGGNSQVNQSPSDLVAALPHGANCGAPDRTPMSSVWHPPDKVCDGSKLYLNFRQLRI